MLGRWIKWTKADDGHGYRGNGKLTSEQDKTFKLRTKIKRVEMDRDI